MNLDRRQILRLLPCMALTTLVVSVPASWAAQPTVEIIAYAHPPVQSALKPLRDGLAAQQGKLRVTEIDMDSPAAAKRLQALGLKGHVPILVLVNGSYKYQRPDGRMVEFLGFPMGPGTPPGARGSWTAQDVQAALGVR